MNHEVGKKVENKMENNIVNKVANNARNEAEKRIIKIDTSSFEPVGKEERISTISSRENLTYWKDAWKRLKANKVAMISLYVIILITILSIVVPMVSPYSYSQQIRGDEFQRPNWKHWFGTDGLGRDLFVRVFFGTRISLGIGLVVSIMILIIGSFYGAISGLIGGKVDNIMMRLVEILYSIPVLLMIILMMVVLKEPLQQAFNKSAFLRSLSMVGPGLISIFLALSLFYWTDMARIVRGQVLSLKEQEYVTAATALGAGKLRIILKHLIPNCMGPIIVTTTFQIPSAIFTEAFMSFIGLGVDAPMASLGSLASDALNGIYSFPHLLLFPAIMISVIILAFNLLGDGLRDALDPRMRK